VSFSDAVSGAKQIQLLGLRGIYTQFLVEAVPLIRGVEMPLPTATSPLRVRSISVCIIRAQPLPCM
jgi:hypothetical protein